MRVSNLGQQHLCVLECETGIQCDWEFCLLFSLLGELVGSQLYVNVDIVMDVLVGPSRLCCCA